VLNEGWGEGGRIYQAVFMMGYLEGGGSQDTEKDGKCARVEENYRKMKPGNIRGDRTGIGSLL